MRYALFSDVHSNLEAFQAVLAAYAQENIDVYLCAGDVVGYGANPGGCLALLKKRQISCAAGNHDWAAAGRLDPSYFNRAAREAVCWTQNQLSKEETSFLSGLPLIHKSKDLILVHGTLDAPQDFVYLTDREQAEAAFQFMDRPVCFVGHTHVPEVFIQEGKNIYASMDSRIKLNPASRYIINVGSVGQPRDGNPLAAYCIYDTDARTFEIKRIAYDIETAQKKIMEAGLPASLARRLAEGY